MRRTLRWALLALVILAVGYLGVGLLVATQLTVPYRQTVERALAGGDLDFSEVSFESSDGLDLEGWWIPADDPSRAVVLVHGLDASKSSPYVLETASIYSRAGYGVLMFDLRGHGESEGERTSLGYQEVRDVQGALGWLKDRGFDPEEVVLHGWSMGAATVVRCAPGTDVAAVVEEAGYADLPLLLRDQLPEASGLPAFFNPGIFLTAKLFLDFDPWGVRPKEDAKELSEKGTPFFIIHSPDDGVVPFEHGRLFAAAYPKAKMWEVEGYDHVEAYTHPEYQQRLLDFLDEAMGPRPVETAER